MPSFDGEIYTTRWWEEDDKAGAIASTVRNIHENQTYRKRANVRHIRLYQDRNVLGTGIDTYSRISATSDFKLLYNVCQSMTDTLTSKITKNKPKTVFLTDEGDWSLQEKAKKRTKFISGAFYELNLYKIATTVFRDACVFDAGLLHLWQDGQKLCAERVFPGEIFIDDLDAVHGNPRSFFRRKPVHKEELIEQFPEHKNKIIAANELEMRMTGNKLVSEHVEVFEAWYLASGDDESDSKGLHVICTENETLLEEEYTKSYAPFLPFKFSEPVLGFWGQGLVEQLEGIQHEISKTALDIQRSFHMFKPKYFVERGAKIVKSHLNNELAGITEYTGTPPQVYSPGNLGGERLQYLQFLMQTAYEIAGVSQLSAGSKKPAGLNSGKALLEYHDIETERFAQVAIAWEDFFLEASRRILDLAEDLDNELEGGLEVVTSDSKSAEKIKFSDIKGREDGFVMKIFPTNFLPDTPAGKYQAAANLINDGFIPQEEAANLLDYPDINAVTSYLNAPMQRLKLIVEMALNKGKAIRPDPFIKAELAFRVLPLAITRAENANAPQERIQILRDFLVELQKNMDKAQAAAMPQPISQPMSPSMPQDVNTLAVPPPTPSPQPVVA